jgi:hypothetical protein
LWKTCLRRSPLVFVRYLTRLQHLLALHATAAQLLDSSTAPACFTCNYVASLPSASCALYSYVCFMCVFVCSCVVCVCAPGTPSSTGESTAQTSSHKVTRSSCSKECSRQGLNPPTPTNQSSRERAWCYEDVRSGCWTRTKRCRLATAHLRSISGVWCVTREALCLALLCFTKQNAWVSSDTMHCRQAPKHPRGFPQTYENTRTASPYKHSDRKQPATVTHELTVSSCQFRTRRQRHCPCQLPPCPLPAPPTHTTAAISSTPERRERQG